MRKIFTGLLIVFSVMLFSNQYVSAAKKKAPSAKHKIEFTTKDKFILVGDLYLSPSKTDKPLIIMLHSYGLSALSWSDLAKNLRNKGYNVLAMDLRGHGRSIYTDSLKLKSRYKFSKDDWQKLPYDVLESVAYIKSNYSGINCDDVVIIGADIGASAGVLAGVLMKKQPQKFVMISPMLNFKGLYIPVKIANYTDTKFFVLLSKSDKVLFSFHTKVKPQIKTYPSGGPGNQLLKVNKNSNDDIINFIMN